MGQFVRWGPKEPGMEVSKEQRDLALHPPPATPMALAPLP